MATDNITVTTNTSISTEAVTNLNGTVVAAEHVQRVAPTLITADGIAVDAPGDATYGQDVDVIRLPALVAGDNNIGNVDIASAIPAGSNVIGKVASVMVTADADLTQIITVTTAGTPAQGPAVTNPGGWILKANPSNTGSVWFMFHGQTKAAKGFPIGVGESAIPPVESLSDLDFDADTSGGKIHAAKL